MGKPEPTPVVTPKLVVTTTVSARVDGEFFWIEEGGLNSVWIRKMRPSSLFDAGMSIDRAHIDELILLLQGIRGVSQPVPSIVTKELGNAS